MALFKCKMCGGTLEINNQESVATCEYCGMQQTLPKLDDDRRANLYDRANHFRRNNEFDKAMGIYEQILNEDGTDAEAYWSLVLCRYGIEYVEDPSSHKRMPTVNRAQFTSIYEDNNYKSALQYADGAQRQLYEDEAKTINEIQKGILAISEKEEPFDVFICYKESDNSGRRTPDSVLAQDLYYQLKQEGFKVFFSRITLEDKIGSAYEPYIFAALNSAKVMVVLGTKPEHFNAVWVKNEWSRYLSLIKSGAKKTLIPAYRDMDPYDLPEEFSHLQAQDMSKLGFMQDLIRGIKKITETEQAKETVIRETVVKEAVAAGASASVAPLLKRAFLFLEDGEWNSADEYCERVLDNDPENGEAYLGKLMAELQVNKKEQLKDLDEPFDEKSNYQKAVRFADTELRRTLECYVESIKVRNENARLEAIYKNACDVMKSAQSEDVYKKAGELFETISGYRDADVLGRKCIEKGEEVRKDVMLLEAKSYMKRRTILGYKAAMDLFATIAGWKDADELRYTCQIEQEKLQEEEERRDKQNVRITRIALLAVFVLVVGPIVAYNFVIPNIKYKDAIALMEQGDYEDAILVFEDLNGFRDSEEKIGEARLVERLNAKSGDYISFGTYEQDNVTTNGKENIKWCVLEKEDNRMLVISKDAIECLPYNTFHSAVTWETCTLRAWLNSEFINGAFSDAEKAKIIETTISNPDNVENAGNATKDKVFLLSLSEVKQYFGLAISWECNATSYARGKSTSMYETDLWWLWSPDTSYDAKKRATLAGKIRDASYTGMVNDYHYVRPAMWIDLTP